MRIAIVQTRCGEMFIFQVKGNKKDLSSIDGFCNYFDDNDEGVGWKTDDIYRMKLAHIGSGDAVVISPELSTDIHGRSCNIEDWLPDEED